MPDELPGDLAALAMRTAWGSEGPKRPVETDTWKRIRDTLFPQQIAFLADNSQPRKAALCTRRAGKTQAVIRGQIISALLRPNAIQVYFATTLAQAKKLVWDVPDGIPAIIHDMGLGHLCTINEADHRVSFNNGSVFWISGAETIADARRWKGLRYDRALIDEAQDFPEEILQYLISVALSPALMPIKGRPRGELFVTGVPAPHCQGLFYDITTHALPGWSVHAWTCYENPYLDNPRAYVEEEVKSRGLSMDDPIVQREYFGRWVRDSTALLYQFESGRNEAIELPTIRTDWSHVLGVDLGFNDLTTFTPLSWSRETAASYFQEAYGEKGATVSRIAELLLGYLKKYSQARIVMDCGALGKTISEELRTRFGFDITPAEKQEKATFVRLMNDAMRLGLIKAHPVRCAQLIDQWGKLQRDDKTLIEKKEQPADYSDAALYAWRYSYSYLHEPKKPPPTPDEVVKQKEIEMWERTLNQHQPLEDREQTQLENDMAFSPWYDAP